MRIKTGQIADLASVIEGDLRKRQQSEVDVRALANLADCIACVLTTRSANSGEWMTVLPRENSDKSKEKWISHMLSSPLIDCPQIMRKYVSEIVKKLSRNGQTAVLMINHVHE
ncbi:hypothetical protein FACS1894122_13250 [Alphaproteobacteria bacterium]|nr:hypothetical protein FACS1894122_13250 [Alphaproteobacteria bacterium]